MSEYIDYLLSHGAKIHSVVKNPKLELQNIATGEIFSIKEIVVFSYPPNPSIYEVFVDQRRERWNRELIEENWRVFEGELPPAQYTQKCQLQVKQEFCPILMEKEYFIQGYTKFLNS